MGGYDGGMGVSASSASASSSGDFGTQAKALEMRKKLDGLRVEIFNLCSAATLFMRKLTESVREGTTLSGATF